jgi:hypothetical protein
MSGSWRRPVLKGYSSRMACQQRILPEGKTQAQLNTKRIAQFKTYENGLIVEPNSTFGRIGLCGRSSPFSSFRHLQGEDDQGHERSAAGGEKGGAVSKVIDDHAGS